MSDRATTSARRPAGAGQQTDFVPALVRMALMAGLFYVGRRTAASLDLKKGSSEALTAWNDHEDNYRNSTSALVALGQPTRR
ncbi:hypothetical protein AC578_2718 [Pseudocercospora eumusae]|uniref:Uncharacterized protein n=1 Tax=Pseudocercospora eumusae TaxID=321146 RepID=A0A139HFZ1_9PEZI|nr:hypothetical protein AC578_2718 [Pseudocercospora eumusae]